MTVDAFRNFARAIDPEITMGGPRSFDMVFADESVSARVTLAPNDGTVVTEIFVHDVSGFAGPVRAILMRALLNLNASAVRLSDFSVGVDSRSFLVLVGRRALAEVTATSFGDALTFWLAQAEALRDFAKATALEGGSLTLRFRPASP